MKLPKIPLHTQIFIALILGAAFGALFAVDPYALKIQTLDEKGAVVKKNVKNWDEILFVYPAPDDEENITQKFGAEDQINIVKFFSKLSSNQKSELNLSVFDEDGVLQSNYSHIVSISKEKTIAVEIKPIGLLFIKLLSFLAIPLVIASLIVGAASLDDIKKLGRIGGKTIALYVATTAVAIIIGLTAANLIQPGKSLNPETKNRLLGAYQSESPAEAVDELEIDALDFLVGIVPKNPIQAMAEGNMLQIVFFAVIFGITLTFIEKKKSAPVINFFDGVSDTMIKMVDFIMKIAPYAVFALIASTIAEFGFGIIMTLLWYIIAVVAGLAVHTLVVYPLIVRFLGKMNPLKFLAGIRNAQAIGFSTSSSAATLPVTIECVEKNLGVPKQISGFVLPLGATINMDGTALYQGVAAVFIAQVYGFNLDIFQQLTVVLTAVLASIGTAPVPGVGIIMLVIILQAVHVPPEGIALILGVDRALDMCRTITNVTGDASVAVAIAGTEPD